MSTDKNHMTASAAPRLSRERLIAFSSTLILIGLTWSVLEHAEQAASQRPARVIPLSLPDQPLPVSMVPPAHQAGGVDSIQPPWDTVTVKPGQTLDAIFRQQGFDIGVLQRIIKLDEATARLTKIRPGDAFDFRRDTAGGLMEMRYPLDDGRYLLVWHVNGELHAETQARQLYRAVEETGGTISTSLFTAGKRAGLTDQMVMKLANIFGWDIDFVQDLRKGDRFMLVYEKIFRDGEFLRDGDILAATFINQGERFQAIRFDDGGTVDYFTPEGRNMRKAFLRAPLNFSYISSAFNPRRMHPVLKRIRPHNGIDYYAPKGTPVYAAGAGTVTRSAYSAANGHHVFIKHANNIETKYLHFTQRTVKQGQKVKQGQTIGTVGSTGLATGPHLHYEFVVNGVHQNPRTVPLPKVEALQGKHLADFRAQAAPMLTQLSRLESASLYAQRP